MIPFSVLDLSPIIQGGDASLSFRNSLDLARHAERWGYQRYWLAEHHGMPGIASAATAVLIGHIANGTATIRVGAGGIMLPNHSPLVIAEQFGTLAALYPGRVDLGVGRAPGTDMATARALRRNLVTDGDNFPQDVVDLINFFEPPESGQKVRAIPGAGLRVPVWILGSSLYGAQLAAHLGLPYAFASHFAPEQMMQAVEIYRERFQPSAYLAKLYVMLGYSVFAADTEAEARRIASSSRQSIVSMRTGRPIALPPPDPDWESRIGPHERAIIAHVQACSAVGAPDAVRQQVDDFIARTGVDELIVTSQVYEHAARLRSYEILAEIHRTAKAAAPGQSGGPTRVSC